MEGGPKSLKAGLKLDEEGRDGDGTEEPEGREKRSNGVTELLNHKPAAFRNIHSVSVR